MSTTTNPASVVELAVAAVKRSPYIPVIMSPEMRALCAAAAKAHGQSEAAWARTILADHLGFILPVKAERATKTSADDNRATAVSAAIAAAIAGGLDPVRAALDALEAQRLARASRKNGPVVLIQSAN